VISRTEPFAGTIVWAYDLDSDGNKTVLTESYRVTKPLSRIGWMIIEKGFGGHDRERDLRRGIHDTLDATKAAAESTQNLPPRTKTSHRVNRSGCATHIPPERVPVAGRLSGYVRAELQPAAAKIIISPWKGGPQRS
jgi:hypothetical protein